jgi:hypothetical protein
MVRPAVGRPFGIALLSVLIIIGGALDIIAGIVTISLRSDGVLLVALEGTEDEVTALGIGFIVVGVLAIVVGTVLWNGSPFARTLVGTVVLARLIATIRSFAALDREHRYEGIGSLVLYAVVGWYVLFDRNAKQFTAARL